MTSLPISIIAFFVPLTEKVYCSAMTQNGHTIIVYKLVRILDKTTQSWHEGTIASTQSSRHTECDFIMLTFHSYRTKGTTVSFKTVGKRMLLLSNGKDRRMLHFQTIQQVNLMATRVQLRSFQSFMNASVVSPVSDCSIAHEIVTFCN